MCLIKVVSRCSRLLLVGSTYCWHEDKLSPSYSFRQSSPPRKHKILGRTLWASRSPNSAELRVNMAHLEKKIMTIILKLRKINRPVPFRWTWFHREFFCCPAWGASDPCTTWLPALENHQVDHRLIGLPILHHLLFLLAILWIFHQKLKTIISAKLLFYLYFFINALFG